MKIEHKSVTIVANADAGLRCHVSLLDKYISKLPPTVFEKDLFYCRPLEVVTDDGPWFMAVPVRKTC